MTAAVHQLPKLCGADFELGNFVFGVDSPRGSGALASILLLRQFEGLPLPRKVTRVCYCAACTARRRMLEEGYYPGEALDEECSMTKYGTSYDYNVQDWARKFLGNGGCAYIDLDHLELCIPEVLSARDHVAASHAMLRLARRALQKANEQLPEGKRIIALANNSDGKCHSYGSHLNVLVTRCAWDDLFKRRLHYLLFLAAYQASSIVFTGQGKVGAENGRPDVNYQISQRADFFDVLVGPQTTFDRPVVNSRDETLCGPSYSAAADSDAEAMARLHVIFYDQTLCHVASLLKVGVMQIIVAMIEAREVRAALTLEDPVEAAWRWSHDPTLQQRAQLASGRILSAVELQLLFCEEAERFVAAGGCDGIVPDAPRILELWADTLNQLQARNYPVLARRLDWVLKLQILERARRTGLDWSTPEIKHLDFMYGSLDSDGLYWAFEKRGLVDIVATNQEIEYLIAEPPENTRAWTRAKLLSMADPQQVERVDWDSVTYSLNDNRYWSSQRTLQLSNPLQYTRAACEHVFSAARTFEQAAELLQGCPITSPNPNQLEGDHYEPARTSES